MHEYAFCGLECYGCEYKEKCGCKGCINSNGNPFHGTCELAKCAINKELNSCSSCPSFPCELLKSFAYDKEHGDKGERIRTLEQIKTGELV